MPATNEVRFYCDRCGVMYATSGEDGGMPDRDQLLLIMSSFRMKSVGWSASRPEAASFSGSKHYSEDTSLLIGSGGVKTYYAPNSYCQVCPRCAAEFRAAMDRLRQWWTSGKRQIAGAQHAASLPKRQPSPRLAAAAAITKKPRSSGSG